MTNNNLDTIARRLAGARNYLYEATMNDYSMESIRRGDLRLQEVTAQTEAAGFTLDIAPWNEAAGCFRPAVTLCRKCARNRGLSRSVNTLPTHDYNCEDCNSLTNEQFQL